MTVCVYVCGCDGFGGCYGEGCADCYGGLCGRFRGVFGEWDGGVEGWIEALALDSGTFGEIRKSRFFKYQKPERI